MSPPGPTTIIAYRVSHTLELEIEPATMSRVWMSDTRDGFANRCLPLLIANQAGWHILGRDTIRAVWDGGKGLKSLTIERLEGEGTPYAISHFGHGIVTFTLPFLFRTPPGVNLLVRGPANIPVDGATALEGIVETDWTPATFTMNWKLTRPGLPVTFPSGEPIAMLVPMVRGALEAFTPEIRAVDDDAETAREFRAWRKSREAFLGDLNQPGSEANEQGWQKDYVLGRGAPDGGHQRKLSLRPWTKVPRRPR